MKTVSGNNHLFRREGVYYYRRRVPAQLIKSIGSKVIQFSLGTTSFKEAKKLRTAKDLEWDVRFETCMKSLASSDTGSVASSSSAKAPPLSEAEMVRLVHEYVERMDERSRKRFANDPPPNEQEKLDMWKEAKLDAQIARDRDHPQADQLIYSAGKEILAAAGKSIDDPALPSAAFAEFVRRGLLELDRRWLARLEDDHRQTFFDQLFNPARPPQVGFGELADQFLQLTEEEAAANRTSPKWVDKQTANVALIREIIGDNTPVHTVDYDTCLRVRTMLARIPANRTKIYNGVSVEQAIQRAAIEDRPLLSPVTQQQYLAALREVLDLAAKKRLISVNPAEGLRPIKRDTIPAGEKRRPFTLEQIKQFFASKFYADCAQHPVPFAHDKSGWRFWLPLICLFMGMRPNEAAQMLTHDLRCTDHKIWYLDIVATSDEDADDLVPAHKTLKTSSSRRKIPVHPELISVGFLKFVEMRTKSGDARLFPDLKPDKYLNHASYALKRFRDTYLPKAIKLEPRQSFYSFRHSWRDALRRIDAHPATLQALGGWTQGKVISDDYGDKFDPDYQAKFMKQIAFPGLDLSALCCHPK
jgi:hypothetical protein